MKKQNKIPKLPLSGKYNEITNTLTYNHINENKVIIEQMVIDDMVTLSNNKIYVKNYQLNNNSPQIILC